jgi:hypothetical protein
MRGFLLLAGTLLAFAAAPALAQTDPMLDRIVANARAHLGVANESGWTVNDARADGRRLVLTVTPSADAQNMFTPGDLAELLAVGFCQSTGGAFFSEGRSLRIAFSGAGASAAGADFAACPATTISDLMLRGTARVTRRMIGVRLGEVSLAAVEIEGHTLVVTFDGRTGWRRRLPVAEVDRQLFTGFCQTASPAFFGDGRAIRADTTENGRNRQHGQELSSCAAYYRPR